MAPVRPQLYLYSPVDVLIPPAEVERFMTQQVLFRWHHLHIRPCDSLSHVKSNEILDTSCSCMPGCYASAERLHWNYQENAFLLQAARGVAVQSKVFPDSPHCEHYRKYPMEYKEQLSKFLTGL